MCHCLEQTVLSKGGELPSDTACSKQWHTGLLFSWNSARLLVHFPHARRPQAQSAWGPFAIDPQFALAISSANIALMSCSCVAQGGTVGIIATYRKWASEWRRPAGHDAGQVAAVAFAGVVSLSTLAFILAFGRRYPIWEVWYFVPVWDAFLNGGPWLKTLFANHWGHIHAVPNGVNLLIGWASGFQLVPDMVFGWLVAAGTFFGLMLRRMPKAPLLVVATALAFFSLRVGEVWLNSWNLMWTGGVAWAALAAFLLSGQLTVPRILAAC